MAIPEDLRQIARALLDAEKAGDWVAAQSVLRWLLGLPPEPIDPYQLMVRTAALEALKFAWQEERGEADGAEAPSGPQPLTLASRERR